LWEVQVRDIVGEEEGRKEAGEREQEVWVRRKQKMG
jgi:hypothetical protein